MVCWPFPSGYRSVFVALLTPRGRRALYVPLKAERMADVNCAGGPQRAQDPLVLGPFLRHRADKSPDSGKGKTWTSKS
jgi:hypothetical protein